MTETDATTAQALVRELHRSRDDRIVVGVAGGLGRYFDLPPLFFRAAFVVLSLIGGAGLLLYAAAALVIPDDGKQDSIAVEALRQHRDRPWLLIGVGLVGIAIVAIIAQARFWPNGGFAWTLLILGAIAIGLSQRRDAGARAADTRAADAGPPPPPRPSLGLPTFGALVAAGGLLAFLEMLGVDVPWGISLAVGAIAVGLVVALGAIFHLRTGLLFLVGIVLAATAIFVSTVDVHISGSWGSRVVRAGTTSDLERNYDVAVGELRLDLRDVTLPPGETHIDAEVGVGQLTVTVPDHANVVVRASNGAGNIDVLGRVADGWDKHVDVNELAVNGQGTLVLDAHVGLGDIVVRRSAD